MNNIIDKNDAKYLNILLSNEFTIKKKKLITNNEIKKIKQAIDKIIKNIFDDEKNIFDDEKNVLNPKLKEELKKEITTNYSDIFKEFNINNINNVVSEE